MTPPAPAPILYVEDDENDVMLLKLGFKRAAVTRPVEVAVDGQQALDYLTAQGDFAEREHCPPPVVVVLDLNLPRFDGFEVLERVRQDPRFERLPVVVFSSSDKAEDMERARRLGASDYVTKPSGISGFTAFARHLQARWLESGS